MSIIDLRRIRDDKINKMLQGESVYVETAEMMRLLRRAIERHSLDVEVDRSSSGCWFMLRKKY